MRCYFSSKRYGKFVDTQAAWMDSPWLTITTKTMSNQPILPPVPEMGTKLFPEWMLEIQEWLHQVHAWVQTIERTPEDPRVSDLERELGDEQERSARQAEELHKRICPCCGHVDGVCQQCRMPHHQAVEGGCELCVQASDVPPTISGESS